MDDLRAEMLDELRDALAPLFSQGEITNSQLAEVRRIAVAADEAINHPPLALRDRMASAETRIDRNADDAQRAMDTRLQDGEGSGWSGGIARGEGAATRLSALSFDQYLKLLALLIVVGVIVILGIGLFRGSITFIVGGTTVEEQTVEDLNQYGPRVAPPDEGYVDGEGYP